MNYPEHIYNTYEIVEKDICGEKHYGLVRVYKLFGFEFSRQLQVNQAVTGGSGYIRNCYSSQKWHNDEHIILSAVVNDNREKEAEFRRKMTK